MEESDISAFLGKSLNCGKDQKVFVSAFKSYCHYLIVLDVY